MRNLTTFNITFFSYVYLNDFNMIKDVVNIIKYISLRHKGVRTFKYQGEGFNNAQNNYGTYQVYLDDISLHELNITNNVFKSSFELYILAQPNDEKEVLDVQNEAFTIACDIIAMIDEGSEFKAYFSVYDYSILTIARYTDDNSSGVKLSLTLRMPNPVSLCSLADNFNDEPYEEEEDAQIDIEEKEVGDIDIKPIRLIPNRRC